MQFNNPTSTKNENKKYDNSTLKKINRPIAFAARFPSSSRSCSPALRFRRQREPSARHRTEAIPTTTPLRAMMRSSMPHNRLRQHGHRLCKRSPATPTGSNNTAVGFHALFNNTTGSDNTAIGSHALFSNTAGNDNTAIGVHALFSNTTGVYNTANGFQCAL